jgi:hypothetical protein
MNGLLELFILLAITVFLIIYRTDSSEKSMKFFTEKVADIYNKYAPYSFAVVREKAKELGQEYTPRQYAVHVAIISGLTGVISYLYFYNIFTMLIYVAISVLFIPYLAYLRCQRVYSEYVFELIQTYTTNVIMEFSTTQSFVKALEGVADSGVLEDPVLSDVREMINMSYNNGTIDESIAFFNEKYPFYMVKNMHQLFLQITKEGARNSGQALENMSSDIDALVEGVYRDQMDRKNFHTKFLSFGLILFFLPVVMQLLLGKESYIDMLKTLFVQLIMHAILIINVYFLIKGEKFYNEDVGGE